MKGIIQKIKEERVLLHKNNSLKKRKTLKKQSFAISQHIQERNPSKKIMSFKPYSCQMYNIISHDLLV